MGVASPAARPAARPVAGDRLGLVPAPVLLGGGIVSVQIGSGIAGRMFGEVSPAGLTGLRLLLAALVLGVVAGRSAWRSVRRVIADRAWRDGAVVVGFGLALGVMNFAFYQAIGRIPLGIAVTIEFLGPLAVAVASSRRALDLLWVGLAGAGVALLGHEGAGGAAAAGPLATGPLAGGTAAGVAFALLAGAGWAAYILLAAATGRRFTGASGLTSAMMVAAIAVLPPAIASSGAALLRPGVLAAGLAIGLLSSVIPYRLELETLRRVPARVFGIWMSSEPAVAALVGLIMLGQALSPGHWLAIGFVMIACAGAAFRSADRSQPPQA